MSDAGVTFSGAHSDAAQGQADLTACEREPIHIPGAIQPHGALLVADERSLRVTHASANLPADVLGRTLASLLGADILENVQRALHDGAGHLGRVCANLPAGGHLPPGDMVVHCFGGRIYVELEEAPDEHLRPDALIGQAQVVIHNLRRCRTRAELCRTAVTGLKALTGFDRVMAYRFDEHANGEVIAEALSEGMEPFLGLHYPASDIPVQARQLYVQQRVRVITDVDHRPVPVLAVAGEEAPLDLSFCHLRAISPAHLEYLRNMGVSATLAISLVPDAALSGLLICHHRTARRVSAQMRTVCDLIGQTMSLLFGATGRSEVLAERVERSAILDAIGEKTLSASSIPLALRDCGDKLLRLVKADGALIQLNGQTVTLGSTPPAALALAIVQRLRARTGEVQATESLGQMGKEFAGLPDTASGAMCLPVLHGPDDAITWFRGEVCRQVTWGGNPDKAMEQDGARLSPRKSFAAWLSTVRGHSEPWSQVDHDMASDLRRVLTAATLRHMEAQARLASLRHYDPLTNLPNRRLLQERLTARARDPQAGPAAMIFLDLDRFKTVNDSLGHTVGDDLLMQVAARLLDNVPAAHLVARLGGDEFVVLCEGVGLPEAEAIAQKLVRVFRTPFELVGKPYRLTTSIGVAAAATGADEEVMRAADLAMYAAKRRGGNQVTHFDRALQESSLGRLELEQDLYEALERREFVLQYQPLVNIRSGAIFSFEALIRWHSPARGAVAPADFIPLAEQTGLIVPIGAWVMREALRQAATWRARHPTMTVSVNVSGQQVARPEFPGEIAAILAESGLPPDALIIEVTESILADNAAVKHLHTVRQAGVRVAVDDFGTGFSSLAYLQRLPVDELKIDKMFVDGIEHGGKAADMLAIIVQLGRTLELQVVAEGVERPAQLDMLRARGCDNAQGYLLGRPLGADEAGALLARSAERTPPKRDMSAGQNAAEAERASGLLPA